MLHFDQEYNPLIQLTPSLDPDPYEDSHNFFTIDLRSLIPEKSPLQLLYIENTSVPSYIFAQTDFPPKTFRSLFIGPKLWILSILSFDWLRDKISL